ncbi:2-oxo acid dehydrogenase subunit E2 [Mycoplasma sp. U97]|uniref:2-oxo acid dehydrogenase subunit E2 n=1 Tax=Mycoplasma tauri TaxID=547987 RepID=UPI001CBE3599|nr:2-oxo acid dehydrogenase subunit E2 [Mycoplasma tauri]MBZ4212585.1 2-oxo acid dehydrogenase subunit E2 [Mycoplasma tauri]
MAEIIKEQVLEAKEVPISGIRKAIAKNLKSVMETVAYVSLTLKADVTNLWNLRSQVKDKVAAESGVKLTFLSWIIKATSIALSEFPAFAAKWDSEKGVTVYPSSINIGIAVDTPHGLFVPVIREVEKLSIIEIQKEIVRLSTLARDKKLRMSDMTGGCFTITNVGSAGVMFGSPIMNKGDVAITATGAITEELKLVEGQVKPSKVMFMSIAADHQWVDGADMARFQGRVIKLLESPEVLGEF